MARKDNFVHLHCHSQFSWDAISSYEELMDTALNNGQEAIGMTEHQHMGGAVEFVQTAKKKGIKPIVGNEFYVETDDGERTHLTVLADGLQGYNSLVRCLNSGVNRAVALGGADRLSYHPIKIDDLLNNSEGLWILTGCPSSMMQAKKEPNLTSAAYTLGRFKSKFGDRVFVEAMLSSDSDDLMGQSLERALQLSDISGLPLVVTNDVHFHDKRLKVVHSFYTKILASLSYKDDDLYLKSRSEMEATLSSIGMTSAVNSKLLNAMDNSVLIANKIQPVTFGGKIQLPTIHDSANEFKKAVWSGFERHIELVKRGKDYEETLKARLDYEMDVILNKGFDTYMLLVQEFIDVAKRSGHAVGKGRGSAAGSCVAYMLGITQINPLDYDLLFERFLNPERDNPPDIDTDLSGFGRDEVINFARDKYGAVPVVTVTTYHYPSLVRDMAKFYRLDDATLDKLLECEGVGEAWDKVCKDYPDWLLIYNSLSGKIRQFGKHAGGIVIDPPDSDYVMPLTTGGDGALAAYSESGRNSSLSDADFIKFDILAVEALTQQQMLEKMTGQKAPELKPDEWNDAFDLIMRNEVDGIFQLGGYAARNYAMRFNPRSINDISLVTSLARTGAMQSGAADGYLKSREISGQVRIRTVEPLNAGKLIEIETGNGIKTHAYSHWQVKLTNNTWKTISDLDGSEDLYVES